LLFDAAEELWDLDEWREAAADRVTGWLNQRPPADSVVDAAPMALQLMTWAAGTGRHQTAVSLGQGVDGALALSGLWGSWEQALDIALQSARAMGDGAAVEGWALHQLGTKALCWGEPATAESLLNQALAIRQEVGVQSAIDATQHNLDVLHLPPGGAPPPDTPPPSEPGPPPPGIGGIPSLVKGVAAVAVVGAIAAGAWFGFGSDEEPTPVADDSGDPSVLEIPPVGQTFAGGGIVAEPSGVAFEPIEVGTVAFRRVDLYNDGDLPVAIEGLYLETQTVFDIGETACPFELDADAGCSIEILFNPARQDDYSDRLVIVHSGEGSPLFVDIFASASGTVDLTASPPELVLEVFAEEGVHRLATEITNTGSAPAEFEFIGTDPEFPFTVLGDSCGGGLDPGAKCEVMVEFASLDIGAYASIAEEQDPASLASQGMPVVMRHSATLNVEPAQGAGLAIPLIATTVAPFPDLVSRIEQVEPVGFNEHDWPIYYVVVTVINVGGVPAESADVGIVYYLPDIDAEWLVPLEDEEGTVHTGELAEFGGEVRVEGFVIIDEFDLQTGSPVVLRAYPDSCVIDDPYFPDDCLVVLELHEYLGLESNNKSEPVDTLVPNRTIVGVVELPDFSDLLELVTTTTVID
jgi:hypothetical protein